MSQLERHIPTHSTQDTGHNPICVYDFTVTAKISRDKIQKLLDDYCKKWGYQQEKGDKTGYEHYQGRISLRERKRLGQVIKLFQDQLGEAKFGDVSITSKINSSGTAFFSYTTKEATRIAGPWTSEDEAGYYIPTRFRGTIDWYPWQLSVMNHEEDMDLVNIVIDPAGGRGKSTLALYMMVHGLARRLPCINDVKDIMRIIMDTKKVPIYFIDIPKAQDKKYLHNFFAAIEEIKNGYCYDDRYHFRDSTFEPPQVWVFTNEEPDTNCLTPRRWKKWAITGDNRLAPYIQNLDDM